MARPQRKSEIILVVFFLLVIFTVPVIQTGLEVRQGERAQFTDVFHQKPTAKKLRQYEKTLEEKSWFQSHLRPLFQHLLWGVFQETGSKAVRGLDGWLFYRPDLRYVVEPDRIDTGDSDRRWVTPAASVTHQEAVVSAIVRFRNQLRERGIQLLVVPVPGKPSVYPDYVTSRLSGAGRLATKENERAGDRRPGETSFRSPTQRLLQKLSQAEVEVVDLFGVFDEARKQPQGSHPPLYLAADTHWTPRGAGLAAQAVARRLQQLGWGPEPKLDLKTQPVSVSRRGDILGMAQIPGMEAGYPAETVDCVQVADANLGLMVPTPSDRPGCFKYPGQRSSVLVLGDSFCRIYQYAEPKTLGEVLASSPPVGEEGGKRLLPGSAGFISHLALALRAPVDAIVSDGGASSDVRKRLSTNPELLEGKKVVIWEFVERDISLGQRGWEDVPLPVQIN